MLALNNLLAAEGLTDLESTNARQQLRLLLRSTRWRDVVPKIPIEIPESLIAPLKQKCMETIDDLRRLESEGRLRIFGDVEHLNDFADSTERVGELR